MKIYKHLKKEQWEEICQRPIAENKKLEKTVKKILQKVKLTGDKAVIKYIHKFDGVKVKKLLVSEKEINAAESMLEPALKHAILQAKNNIELFHTSQKEKIKKTETMPGVSCWRQSVAIEVFNFGKFKGRPVCDVLKAEPQYYDWMMKGDFPQHTKQKLTEIYTRTMLKKN